MLRIQIAPSLEHEMSMVPSGEKLRWDGYPVDGVRSRVGFIRWKTILRVFGNLGRYIWLIFDVGGVRGSAER